MNGFNDLVGASAQMRHAAIEEMCEKSLLDPEMRGVLVVDNMNEMTTEVSLESSVPWGHVYYRSSYGQK